MPNYEIHFNIDKFQEIDRIALSLCQDDKLGNINDWFGDFRGGIHNFYTKLYGVEFHYNFIHSWKPIPNDNIEYHLSAIFYNLDSAIESLVYTLNAIGYAISKNGFHDISNEKSLSKISPNNIIGGTNSKNPNTTPIAGYEMLFRKTKRYWIHKKKLIYSIIEQHDTSKHRKTIFSGSDSRFDIPDGFFELFNIPDDPCIRTSYYPVNKVILTDRPKQPLANKQTQDVKDFEYLEDLVHEFTIFVKKSGDYILSDLTQYPEIKQKQIT